MLATEKKELLKSKGNDDSQGKEIKVLASEVPVSSPGKKILFLKTSLDISSKIKFTQKTEILLTSIKYILEDCYTNKVYKCEAKTYTDSFKICDSNGQAIYKFKVKEGKHHHVQFVINDLKENEEKTVDFDQENSNYQYILKGQFLNEGSDTMETLYIYCHDRKTDIFYGKRKSEGGNLLCEAGRYAYGSQTYDIEFAPGVDKTFMLILFLGVTRYVQARNLVVF